jgi:hypothetical protein
MYRPRNQGTSDSVVLETDIGVMDEASKLVASTTEATNRQLQQKPYINFKKYGSLIASFAVDNFWHIVAQVFDTELNEESMIPAALVHLYKTSFGNAIVPGTLRMHPRSRTLVLKSRLTFMPAFKNTWQLVMFDQANAEADILIFLKVTECHLRRTNKA